VIRLMDVSFIQDTPRATRLNCSIMSLSRCTVDRKLGKSTAGDHLAPLFVSWIV
jgi:hypothetical protein